MARHKVESFSVKVNNSGGVDVRIQTKLKKPYNFHLRPDEHYPTVEDIEQRVTAALQHCIDTYEKVDVSVFAARDYLNINVKDHLDTRFTGTAVKAASPKVP